MDKLQDIIEGDKHLLAWVSKSDSVTLKAALNIGKWVIEKVSALDITFDTSHIREEAHAEAQAIVSQKEGEMRKTIVERDIIIREKDLLLKNLYSNLEDKERKLQEMDNALKNIVNEFCEGELNKLRHLVVEKESEIKALKNSNAVKGFIGEHLIMDTLRNVFKDADVVNTGKQAHECDIHMTDIQGNVTVFESKYKSTITKGDIDKFYFDVTNLSPINAAIFVSINTCNIPGKGDIAIEVFNDIPLLFVGFRGADEFEREFPSVVRLFMKFVNLYHIQNADKQKAEEAKQIDIERLMDEVESCMMLLIKNRTRISDLRSVFDKTIDDIESNNRELIGKMNEILEASGRNRTQLNVTRQQRQRTLYTCSKCNKEVFTNKKDLAKHQRTCGGAAA